MLAARSAVACGALRVGCLRRGRGAAGVGCGPDVPHIADFPAQNVLEQHAADKASTRWKKCQSCAVTPTWSGRRVADRCRATRNQRQSCATGAGAPLSLAARTTRSAPPTPRAERTHERARRQGSRQRMGNKRGTCRHFRYACGAGSRRTARPTFRRRSEPPGAPPQAPRAEHPLPTPSAHRA
jgi:hypothetical protein